MGTLFIRSRPDTTQPTLWQLAATPSSVNGVVGPVAGSSLRFWCGCESVNCSQRAKISNLTIQRPARVSSHSFRWWIPFGAVATRPLRILPRSVSKILSTSGTANPSRLRPALTHSWVLFGAVSQDGSDDFVSIMRFDPTALAGAVTDLPIRLVEPVAADADSAIRRRQFVLDSGLCGAKRRPRMACSPACASTARP